MRVAVIDIGSNTIKLLVAARAPAGAITTVRYAVEEARIGRGLGDARPTLTPESLARGLAAVQNLLALATADGPTQVALVATSAVRDAANGAEFATLIERATGHRVRILSGQEEADYIGRGLAADPALAGARDFYLFDLGGGSLECLEFRNGRRAQSVSVPLGCVRLTERCVRDPAAPFTASNRADVVAVVREAFSGDSPPFRFTLPSPAAAVATGGTVTTVRGMLAAVRGARLEEQGPAVAVGDLESLLARTAALPLAARRDLPALPPARADVFPTALATLLEVARLAHVDRMIHSFYNLRYGVADEMLARSP